MMISRIIEHLGKKYFLRVEQEQVENDKIMKILACDGKSVWESTKSTRIVSCKIMLKYR